jgi:hypothetical protein
MSKLGASGRALAYVSGFCLTFTLHNVAIGGGASWLGNAADCRGRYALQCLRRGD